MLTKKIFKLSTGNRLYFTKNPPFGFWTVNYERGGLPSNLGGNYTSFQTAYAAVETYLGHKDINIEEEEKWLDQLEM